MNKSELQVLAMVRDTYTALNNQQKIARRFKSFHYAMQNCLKNILIKSQNTIQLAQTTFENDNNTIEEQMDDEDEDDDDDDDDNYETELEERTRKELAERERKANNIVFYGLLTGSYPKIDVFTYCAGLLENSIHEFHSYIEWVWLRKRTTNGDQRLPLVFVRFNDLNVRKMILAAAKRRPPRTINGIYINPDYTFQQLYENYLRREKARQQKNL